MAWPTSDTFTGTGGTLLSAHAPDSGGAWTLHPSYSGTAQLDAANRLRQTSTTASCYYAPDTPTSADYDVTIDINRLSTGAFPSTVGICGRLDTSADTCYTARSEIQGSNWALYKRVAGTETSLGTSSTPSIVVGTPNTVTLRMSGTTIQVIVDGVTKISVTDSAISAAGRAGVRFSALNQAPTDTTLMHLDNLTTADVLAPVFPPQPVPDRARGLLRAAAAAYIALVSATPVDQGVEPPGPIAPRYADSAPGPRRPAAAAYFIARTVPPDPGTAPPLASAPDRVPAPARAASQAYQFARPIPPDPGDASAPSEYPDMARGPRRAAPSAYSVLVPAPWDSGDASCPTEAPDLARGPARAAASAYLIPRTVPPDEGDAACPTRLPALARGPARAANAAYLFARPVPGDAGDPSAPASVPDRPPVPRRAAPAAYFIATGTPPDAGDPSAPAECPDLARGPARASSSAYLVATGTPRDVGDLSFSIQARMPETAPGPRRAAAHAYSIATPAPPDEGFVAPAPPIAPSMPERAPGPAWRQAGPTLASAMPKDQGLPSVPTTTPDRASGPRRSATQAYMVATGTPPDDGAVAGPIAPEYPDAAPGRRRAAQAAYRIVVPAPPDLGAVPGPVRAACPDSAPGRRRAAPSAYRITVPAPADAGLVGLVYRIYCNAGSGDPIDYTTIHDTTSLLTWTSGVMPYPGEWKFGVRVFDAATELEERNVDAVVRIVLDGSGEDVTAMPDPPTGLSGVPRAAGSIRLDWSYALVDPARKPTGFRVYRGTGGTPSYVTPVATTAYSNGVVNFSATATGGSDGTAYTFGVRAYNATGEESNVLKVTVTAVAAGPASVAGLSGGATA